MANARNHRALSLEAVAGRISKVLGDNHKTGQQLQAEVTRLSRAADALDRLNQTRNPLDTPAAHAMKVAKSARTFSQEVTATFNRAVKVWGAAYGDLQARIIDKTNLRPDAFAGEIRAAFRTMSSKQKMDLIQELIEENRGPELAAIVKAPSMLTGISEEQKQSYEKSFVARHASAELDELAKLEETWSAVIAATNVGADFAADLTNPAKLSAIETAAATADAAGEAFNQALQ